jgi:hypothetical protein
VVAAVAAAEALALAESAAVAGAEAVAELHRRGFSVSARGRVRKLAPSDGWQTTAEAVAWRVVEDEQEDAVEDDEVVQEEDLSDEEADSAGPQWSGWCRRGRYWRKTGPGGEEG